MRILELKSTDFWIDIFYIWAYKVYTSRYSYRSSAKKDSSRPAFHQMIEECKAGLTDIVVVKSISRLGRDTVEVLDAINILRESQVRIIFKQEELDTLTVGSSLLISTIEACTQADYTISQNSLF